MTPAKERTPEEENQFRTDILVGVSDVFGDKASVEDMVAVLSFYMAMQFHNAGISLAESLAAMNALVASAYGSFETMAEPKSERLN